MHQSRLKPLLRHIRILGSQISDHFEEFGPDLLDDLSHGFDLFDASTYLPRQRDTRFHVATEVEIHRRTELGHCIVIELAFESRGALCTQRA